MGGRENASDMVGSKLVALEMLHLRYVIVTYTVCIKKQSVITQQPAVALQAGHL